MTHQAISTDILQNPDTTALITQLITEGTLQTGSDGSLNGQKMTCSWAIHTSQQIYIQGGTLQTTTAKPSSTRAERAGRYHLLQSLLQIATSQSIAKGSIIIHINNTKAMATNIMPPGSGPYKFLLTDFDYA